MAEPMTLAIWDGDRKIWSGEPPVANAAVQIRNQVGKLSASKQSDGVVVTLVAPNVPALPVGLPKLPPVVQPVEPEPMPKVGPRKIGLEFDPRRPLTPNK